MSRQHWKRKNPYGSGPIELFEGPVQSVKQPRVTGRGRVVLDWADGPHLLFQVVGARAELLSESLEPFDSGWVLDARRVLEVTPVFWEFLSRGQLRLTCVFTPATFGAGEQLSALRSSLVNYSLSNLPELWLLGGGWRIHITDLGKDSHLPHDWGYYDLTQEVSIEKVGGRPFPPEEGLEVVSALATFASLTRGAFVGFANAQGSEVGGTANWQHWEVTRADRSGIGRDWATLFRPDWHDAPSERDRASADPNRLPEMWRGFYSMWRLPELGPTLTALTALYIEAAAHTEAEAGLVIANTVLDLLSWAIVVNDKAMISAEGHDRLTPADRIRLLLAVAQRGSGSMSASFFSDRKHNWTDAAHAITDLRNAIVHPVKRQRLEASHESLWGAYRTALEYIETTIEWWLRSRTLQTVDGSGGEAATRDEG